MKEYIVTVNDDDMDYEEVFIAYIRDQKELIQCKDRGLVDSGKYESWCTFHGIEVWNEEEGFCCWAEKRHGKKDAEE